jgi:hypothetical protein
VCDIDLRVGGEFHFVSQRPTGKKVGQRGNREIAPPRAWSIPNGVKTGTLANACAASNYRTSRGTPSSQHNAVSECELRDTILESGNKDTTEEFTEG